MMLADAMAAYDLAPAVAEDERIAQDVYLPRGRCRRVSREARSIAVDRDHAVEMFQRTALPARIAKDVASRLGAIALLGVFGEEVLRDAGHAPVGDRIGRAAGHQPIQPLAQDHDRRGREGLAGQAGDLVLVGEKEKCRRHHLRRHENDERQDCVESCLLGEAHEGILLLPV